MDEKYSKLRKTTQAFIDGFEAWDIEAIMATRSENCLYYTLPASLNRPPLNNADYRAYFSGLLPYLKNFRVKVLETVVDTTANQVALYVRSTAESVVGPYQSEQTVILKMTDDLEKVYEAKEFFDTAGIQNTFAELGKYIENGGKPIEP